MKKQLFAAICMCMAVSLVFSNGQGENTDMATEKSEIHWLYENATPENEAALRENFIDVVNERTDAFELSVRFDPNFDQNLRTSMLAGNGPDIVQTAGPSYVQEFAKESYLLPLDEYAEKYGWKERFFPMMIDLGSYDGTLYALPKAYEAMALFYNKTLFNENGWEIPRTWEDFDLLCKEIRASGVTPIITGNSGWKPVNEHYVTIFFNHIAGPENVRKALKGEIPWTDPVFVRAIENLNYFFHEHFTEDYFSYGQLDTLTMLAHGEAAMYPSGTWNFQNIGSFFDEAGNEWDWAPLPSAEGGSYPVYDLGVGATLSINADCADPDAAAEVLETLSGDTSIVIDMNVSWPGEWNLPINSIKREDFGDKVDPRYARSIEEIADAVDEGGYGFTTWTFWPPKTNQYIWEGIEQVWVGQLSVEDYLEEMDKIFQKELRAGQVPPIPGK